ncbi:hypothetical protein ANANG_G00023260 [Anguilla anguilla]|uniref:Uncharacterized protein n=1 Tax=Anguilla anguilla TaxID=7936 RepID=A0A9D3S6T8_ANGAN|nr:hypothetical protein ANANG_G00023260 [Anguilla anguilla]
MRINGNEGIQPDRILTHTAQKQHLTKGFLSACVHPSKVRMSSCGSCLYSIVWLIILLALAWPLSIFLGGLYGFIAPLTTCVGLDRLTDLLLEGANLGAPAP